ncbi:hypothetical protein ASD78_00565 [Lysobacter sp. Root667]|nr:hypothetical protein ASD78_00565 [Lysobacter sp. Root667]
MVRPKPSSVRQTLISSVRSAGKARRWERSGVAGHFRIQAEVQVERADMRLSSWASGSHGTAPPATANFPLKLPRIWPFSTSRS